MKIVEVNEQIFREYDIRGIYGEDLSEDVAYTVGRSFGTYVKKYGEKKVVIGRDNRTSSPILSEAMIKGILESGTDVVNIGMVTTPMFYFAKKLLKLPAGIMITASHNPSEYNGFKTSFEAFGNAYGKMIKDFGIFTNRFQFDEGSGTEEKVDISEDYIRQVEKSVDFDGKKPRVVVDLGMGVASTIVSRVMDRLGFDYVTINEKKDLSVRSEYGDPSVKEKMYSLRDKVLELGYDLGIGLDGDADRVGVVDENGYILNTEEYMVIMYRYLNKNLKTRRGLIDVKCGMKIIDELKKLDIEPFMNRTGNSYQNIAMQDGDFDFGGEFSGHLWFRDRWIGTDDGLYNGLRMAEVMTNTKKKLSELRENMVECFSTPEIKVKVTEENKFQIVDKVLEYAKNKKYKLVTKDGVRIEFPDSWVLIRASNTGPNLTVRAEARTEERMNELKDKALSLIEEYSK